MPFFYTIDVYYWIILIPAFLVALAALVVWRLSSLTPS